jgi:hypothetical protein
MAPKVVDMSKYAPFLPFGLVCLTGCIVYPRFAHVYTSPEYHGLVLDQDRRPVPNATVRIPTHNYKKPLLGRTNAEGTVFLPAQGRFEVLGMLVMDPPRPFTNQRITWTNPKTGKTDSLTRRVRFVYGSRKMQVIADTVLLP